MILFIILLKIILIPFASPLCVGIIRKVKANMQNRKGASIIQPYFNLWKLFHKNEVIAHEASWIFLISPFLIFGISLLLPLGIPLLGRIELFPLLGDFISIVYLLAIMTFFLALSGIDTGSAFGGFGSSREMTLAALTEGTLLFSILPIALITHTTNLTQMAITTTTLPLHFAIAIAFMGFFIALLSETGRIPFDNPSTHLELTMIHEAMILEYSGKRLALIEWASANKFLFFVLLGSNLFFPWTIASTIDPSSILISLATSIIKAVVLIVAIGIIESSIAKLRLFRLPDLLLTGFMLCIISLIVINI